MSRMRYCAGAWLLSAAATLHAADPADASLGLFEQDEESPGHVAYVERCSHCHDAGTPRAPSRRMLQFLSTASIYRALSTGVMQQQAAALTDEQKQAVAEYLTGRPMTERSSVRPPAACEEGASAFDWSDVPLAPNWGLTWGNTREVARDQAEMGTADVPGLRLAWAFEFPDALRARSHPLLAGGAVFTGSQSGSVYALDRESGCVRWTFQAGSEVRTGIATSGWARGDEQPTLYFGDLLGNVYAVAAATGELVWRAHPDDHPAATITGTPTYYAGRLYVPVSSLEVVSATDSEYACCTFRGSVVAYDAATGERLWQRHTVADSPRIQGKNPIGTDRLGPSGAPVWNSPAIDPARGLLYVGTGENYSSPATSTSDAIFAIDLLSGAIRWVYQATANDAWNSACVRQERHNCPAEDGPDYDFGAAMVLARTSDGRDVLLGPQKSGAIHALDPDDGRLLWRTKVGRGGLHGGVHFGIAVSGDRVFVPISDAPDTRDYDAPPNPGLFALDLKTGSYLWRAPLGDECNGRDYCAVGFAAAITATPDLVFAGALDGYLRIYDTATGALLRKLDTTRPVTTVSGAVAAGGSMDGGAAPVPYHGMLFVNSGYNFAGHMPGNVLLVYQTEARP